MAKVSRMETLLLFLLLLAGCHCDNHEVPDGGHEADVPLNSASVGGIHVMDAEVSDNSTRDFQFTLHSPSRLLLRMEFYETLVFNYTINCKDADDSYVLDILTSDRTVAEVNTKNVTFSCSNATEITRINGSEMSTNLVLQGSFDLRIYTELIGRAKLFFSLRNTTEDVMSVETIKQLEEADEDLETYDIQVFNVLVIRQLRPIDIIFRVVIYIFIIGVNISFGSKLDLKIVKETLKKPIAPIIGFCCQYLIMPLLAFGIAKIVTKHDVSVSLGIFVAGCCPGGGASNIYSYLLGGDLSLSITMTTLSTIGALAMLPMWIYSLGSLLRSKDVEINIPFLNIFTSLLIIVLPLVVGVFIRFKLPRVAKIIVKVMKPVTVVAITILISVGIYSNLYIFKLFKPKIILAGCLLPYFGYVLGGVVSFICRQPWTRIKTIAIETGLQNTSIAMLLMLNSFPPPDGDIAAVAPIASAVMTPLPLFAVTIAYLIYKRCTRDKYKDVPTSDKEDDKIDKNKNKLGKQEKERIKLDKKKRNEREKNGVLGADAEKENEIISEKLSAV